MAQKQIIWSVQAQEELYQILDYYIDRNKSSTYSKKLLLAIEKLIAHLPKNNSLGRISENGFTRVLIKKNFLIFYEVYKDAIVIVSLWDNRQDPEKRFDKM